MNVQDGRLSESALDSPDGLDGGTGLSQVIQVPRCKVSLVTLTQLRLKDGLFIDHTDGGFLGWSCACRLVFGIEGHFDVKSLHVSQQVDLGEEEDLGVANLVASLS